MTIYFTHYILQHNCKTVPNKDNNRIGSVYPMVVTLVIKSVGDIYQVALHGGEEWTAA